MKSKRLRRQLHRHDVHGQEHAHRVPHHGVVLDHPVQDLENLDRGQAVARVVQVDHENRARQVEVVADRRVAVRNPGHVVVQVVDQDEAVVDHDHRVVAKRVAVVAEVAHQPHANLVREVNIQAVNLIKTILTSLFFNVNQQI